MKVTSYKDLIVWKKSMILVETVYALTGELPPSEKYGLSSQIQRSSVAIPSNIAEGHARRHRKEFLHFLNIALGSAAELETQLIICSAIYRNKGQQVSPVLQQVEEIKRMLYVLHQRIGHSDMVKAPNA